MVDIVSVLSLQGRARRNAKASLRILQRQRAERAAAARVDDARLRLVSSPAAGSRQRSSSAARA